MITAIFYPLFATPETWRKTEFFRFYGTTPLALATAGGCLKVVALLRKYECRLRRSAPSPLIAAVAKQRYQLVIYFDFVGYVFLHPGIQHGFEGRSPTYIWAHNVFNSSTEFQSSWQLPRQNCCLLTPENYLIIWIFSEVKNIQLIKRSSQLTPVPQIFCQSEEIVNGPCILENLLPTIF